MFKKIENNKKNILFILIIIIFSFLINYYTANKGLQPKDTFIHFDFGFRILLGEYPVKDYWIVHGFIIDFIQSFFFKILGSNWFAYVFHSSFLNILISISAYFLFKELEIKNYICFILSLSIASLAYPISGTPFLDLHATYFSLIAIFLIIYLEKRKLTKPWFFVSIIFCLAFFSKQVPSSYIIFFIVIYNIYLCIIRKEPKLFFYFISGALFFLIALSLFLLLLGIPIYDFIFQIFIFPQSIGLERFKGLELDLKNVFLNFKFIYIFLIPILLINIFLLKRKNNFIQSEYFNIFLVLLSFVISIMYHQIYTKNQTYIFSLIPILCGFFIYYLNIMKFKRERLIIYFSLILVIFLSFKYHSRFNIERKFHDLQNINFNNSINAKKISNKLKGLKWKTPYFQNPQEEIDIINNLVMELQSENRNKMIISDYNFLSLIINDSLHTPSRTFDRISYPLKDSKYYVNYKNFLIKKIKDNDIKLIYVFNYRELSQKHLDHRIFNYLNEKCFNLNNLNKYLIKMEIKNCLN